MYRTGKVRCAHMQFVTRLLTLLLVVAIVSVCWMTYTMMSSPAVVTNDSNRFRTRVEAFGNVLVPQKLYLGQQYGNGLFIPSDQEPMTVMLGGTAGV